MSYRERIYERYATNFQSAAPSFDEGASLRWGKAYRHYFRGWLPENPNAKVIDLACGGGKLLHFFKVQGFTDVRGVDISPEQITLAQQIDPRAEVSEVISFLARNSGQFDLITGLDIVEHFHKPEILRFLDNCYSALRPKGRLILQTPNMDSPWGTAHRYNDLTHEVGFNPNSLSRLLSLTGFGKIQVREAGPVPFGYSFTSSVRSVGWQAIRASLWLWNNLETGNGGSGIFTRIFLASGVKV